MVTINRFRALTLEDVVRSLEKARNKEAEGVKDSDSKLQTTAVDVVTDDDGLLNKSLSTFETRECFEICTGDPLALTRFQREEMNTI